LAREQFEEAVTVKKERAWEAAKVKARLAALKEPPQARKKAFKQSVIS
jgi:hypothetical protein